MIHKERIFWKNIASYSDKQLGEKTQQIFLEVAEFVIRIVLEPAEQVYFKRRLIAGLEEIWRPGGFLQPKRKKWDFEIRVRSGRNKMKLLEKKKAKELYYLAFERDFASKRFTTPYFVSPPVIDMMLREIVAFLLKKNGFLLHASSCLDRHKNLYVFLAPSGGGKTTAARLLSKAGFTQVSDDMLIVKRQKGNGWRFFSPPFVEKDLLPFNRGVIKDARFFFVKKAGHPKKKKIDKETGVLRLILSQVWTKSKEIEKQTFANVARFIEENDHFYILNATLNPAELKRVIYKQSLQTAFAKQSL